MVLMQLLLLFHTQVQCSKLGYDMEDAMIINKSSLERGFGHGCIYKSKYIDLSDLKVRGQGITNRFASRGGKFAQTIDLDGLPHVGQLIQPGDPLYSIEDEVTGHIKTERYDDFESAYVEEVRLLGGDTGDEELQKIQIKFRLNRRPDIGDKFSSRHGQKGVLSQRFPMVDMPFSESGMVPDVIINPHAFPSRMTIGMFVESMAGKSGALHGLCQDATPFK
jgi:DNA-directed RNA polymerase I subunit RPA2